MSESSGENKTITPIDTLQQAVQAARNSLTPEQRAHYKKLGEALYGRVNVAEINEVTHAETSLQTHADIISSQLRSGLLPSELTPEEIGVMVDVFGKNWYKLFGYRKIDLRKA